MRTLRTAPALDALTWHAGHDPSGRVRVELDGPGHDVRVALAPGWRAEPGSGRLGHAVVAAHGEAVVARMTAWALEGAATPTPPATDIPVPEQVAVLDAAHRELAVFRRRLAELRALPVTVRIVDGVSVTVRDGRPASIDVTRPESEDPRMATALAAALRVALSVVARQPAEALARCPALRAVLGTSLMPLPFEF